MRLKNYVLLYCLTCLGLVVSVIGYDWYEGSNFDSQWHSLGLYSLVVSFVLTSLYFAYNLWQQKRQAAEIKLLNDKLVDLLKEDAYHHVILKPSDPYYELAQSINAIQSKQKRFVKNFVRQQRGYFSLLEYLTSGVMLIDQDNLIYTANHALNEIFAKDLNQKQSPYYYVLDNFELIQLIEQAIRTKSDQAKEIRHHQDGEKLLAVQVRYIPLSKHHFLIMCLVDDVTQKRKLEQQQKDFLANLSHELKTPLTNIKGYLIALEDVPETMKKKFLNTIKTNVERLENIVLDFLNISKIENSNLINISQVGVEKLKKELLDILAGKINEKKAQVEFIIELTDRRDYLKVDSEKLSMILKNLIENGIVYNKNSEPKVTVKIVERGDRYNIAVEDNGMGIPIYEQDKIFERFYRVDKARTSNLGGTGLGLSIVKTLVEKCGGGLSIDSIEGKGTVFSFYISK